MRYVKAVVVGAITFVAIHVVLVATWQRWFAAGDGLPPWFMNSVPTVLVTLGAFAVASGLSFLTQPQSARDFDARAAWAALVATGGAIAMLPVLFTMRGGPGNLFPIAIFIGWVVMFAGSAVGCGLAWLVRRPRAY
jgi:hypothetical protein